MSELKSPKLLNSLAKQQPQGSNRIMSQPEKDDTTILLQLLQKVLPVEVLKSPLNSRKRSQSMLYLNEDEVEYRLIEYIQKGISDFQNNRDQQALFQFKQAEQILTAFQTNTFTYQLIIKINLGVSYYSIGWLENAFTCFEDAIIAFKKSNRFGQQGLLLNTIRLHCYLQCCIILSEIGQHAEALSLAKIAIKKSIKLLIQLTDFVENQLQKTLLQEILKKNAGLNFLKLKYLNILLNYPSLNQSAIKKFDLLFEQCPQSYIQKANILSFIQMSPISLSTFQLSVKFPNAEQLLHSIGLLVISLYCASTESRFVEHITDPHQFSEAENFLSRSLEIVFLYCPKDMPIVNQLLNVHNRFHDLSKHVIHEDSHTQKDPAQQYEMVLLKPLVESHKCSFAIPIIRKSKTIQIKERAKSMKETLFSNQKPYIGLELKTFENSKPQKRKLRSISTTNKGKPNSPKWNHLAAEVYLKRSPLRNTYVKRPTTKSYINKTVEIPQLQKQQLFFDNPNKKLNINLLFINNLNHINYTAKQKKKSSIANTLDQLLKTGQLKHSFVQQKIKNLIKSYQI